MKSRTIFLLVFTITTFLSFGQQNKDTLYIDSIYVNVENYIVTQKVLEFDSIGVEDLKLYFENWGGQNFRNYSEVVTSKTENQITLNYITSSFNIFDMYVQMSVEFKPNRIRITMVDDGNVFKPGSYSGGYSSPAVAAHSYHVKDYFSDGSIIFKTTPGALNIKEKYASGAKNYRHSADLTIRDIKNFISEAKQKKTKPTIKSDW